MASGRRARQRGRMPQQCLATRAVSRRERSPAVARRAGRTWWAGTGSNRRPCGFQPGAARSDPSGALRSSRIRLLSSAAVGGPGRGLTPRDQAWLGGGGVRSSGCQVDVPGLEAAEDGLDPWGVAADVGEDGCPGGPRHLEPCSPETPSCWQPPRAGLSSIKRHGSATMASGNRLWSPMASWAPRPSPYSRDRANGPLAWTPRSHRRSGGPPGCGLLRRPLPGR